MKSPKNLMTRDQVGNYLYVQLDHDSTESDVNMVNLLISMVDAVNDMSERFNLGLTGFTLDDSHDIPECIDCHFSDSTEASIFIDGHDTPVLVFNN